MNKEQLLKELEFAHKDGNKVALVIYFHLKDASIMRADVEDPAKDELLLLFQSYIKNKFADNEKMLCKGLSEVDDRKDMVYCYDYEDIPDGLKILNSDLDIAKVPTFDFSKNKIDELKGFVITIGDTKQNRIVVYKKHDPISIIKRDAKYLGLRLDNQRMVKVDEDILRINGTFEFMKVNNKLIIVNERGMNMLEREFGFERIVRKKAGECIERIERSSLLEDMEDIKEFAADIKNARKVMNIRSNSKVLEMKSEDVLSFIMGHKILGKKFHYNKCKTKLVLKTKVSQKLFLQLLNDDFLKSQLTDIDYLSENKDLLTDN